MGTKINSNYSDLLTFTRASKGHALRPVSYGDELVTNGTYDDSSALNDWEEFSGTLSVVSQKLRVTQTTGSNPSAGQTVNTTIGKIYSLTVDYFPDDANAQILVKSTDINGSILYNEQNLTSDGTYRNVFVATKSSIYIQLVAQSSTTGHYAEFDNVSLKEVLFDQPDGTLTLFEHPDGVPRVEWDADRNRLGLLVEEQRTNLVLYSEDFSTDWNNTNDHIDVNPYGGSTPDGQASGFEISERSRTGRHALRDTHSFTSGLSYTFSVFAKKSTSDWCQLFIGSGAFPTMHQNFNLATGQKGSGSGVDSSQIQDFGNGWYRISITATANATTGSDVFITLTDNSDSGRYPSYAGDGTSGIYIYGAQLEAGSFPTSYIKNEGTSGGVTRSADLAKIPVADFGYNQSVGTVLVEAKATGDDSSFPRFVSFQDDPSNRWEIIGDTALDVRFFHRFNAVTDVNGDLITNVLDGKTSLKVAYAKAENDAAGVANGGSVVTDTSNGQLSQVVYLYIGAGSGGTSDLLNGHIKSIKYYPRRLTNAQLQALTEPRSTPTLSLTFDGLESSYTENYIHG